MTRKFIRSRLILLFLLASTAMADDHNFTISLRVLEPMLLESVQNLVFPDVTVSRTAFSVTVSPNDAGASTFWAEGRGNRAIAYSVVTPTIYLSAPGVETNIRVDGFDVYGPTVFNSDGTASFRIGATANLPANIQGGDYSGVATFRVTYQ